MASERAYMLPDRSGLESWLHAFHRLNPARRDVETHAKLLNAAFGKCPMILSVEGETVACGLGISATMATGLVWTSSLMLEHRRKGYGRELTEKSAQLGTWKLCAHGLTWQVMTNNKPTLALYAQLGFKNLTVTMVSRA